MDMYYTTRRGYLNIILLVIILLALLALVSWLAYQAGGNAAEGRLGVLTASRAIAGGVTVPLTTISLAQNANLSRTTGAARVGSEEGKVEIDAVLADGVSLPEGSVLAGWLWSAGGAQFTFYTGAAFTAIALAGLVVLTRERTAQTR